MKMRAVDSHEIPIDLNEQLQVAAGRHPRKTAVIYNQQSISYEELESMVDSFSRLLIYHGVQKKDRVLFALHRRPEVIVAFLSIVRIGAVAVPLNFRGSAEETDDLRKLITPACCIVHSDLRSMIGIPMEGESIVEMDENIWEKLSGIDMVAPDFPDISPDDTIYLNMTSGSSGRPKAAIVTQRQLFHNTMDCCRVFHITQNDVHLPLFAVMSHPHEIFCRALMTGGTIVLVENLYPRSIAEAISRHRITCVMAVPPVYELLLPFAQSREYNFSSLRLPESGGMNTPANLRSKFKETFGMPLVPVWGSTETMGVAFAPPDEIPEESVGKPLPSYETRIVNTESEQVKTGQIGELWLRGPALTQGYYRSDEETHKSRTADGWYKTGDLFLQDAAGYFFCHGRMDAMIKVGGLKVYPAEIEAVLFSHPLIREAVVIPYQDRLRGAVALAAVVIEPGETLTEAQVKAFLRDRLPRYKIPRIIRFLPALPRTPGGKIDRKSLVASPASSAYPPEVSIQMRIQSIDLKILHLLNERLKLVLELKPHLSRSGFQPGRIEETIRTLQEFNPGPIHDTIVEELFRKILSISLYL